MNYIFDWDTKYKQVLLKCENLDLIREHFSVENKIAKLKRFKNYKYMPQRNYAITKGGRFDIGLLYDVCKYISSSNIPHHVIVTKEVSSKFKIPYENINLTPLNMELRDYQVKACSECLNFGRGIVVLPTASGKTLVIASIIKSLIDNKLCKKCLFITPSIQLIEQTYKDFIEYGINNSISMWSGDNLLNPTAEIIIAGTSILQSETQDLSILGQVDLVIIDECHKIRNKNEINDIFKKFNTNHFFGFTGTMCEDKLDQWNVIGKIGPILFEKESSELRDNKYISNALIKIIKIKYKNKPIYPPKEQLFDDPTVLYDFEIEFLHNNEFRNQIISKLCQKLSKNTLIMIDRIHHGEVLFESLQKNTQGKQIYFIRGEVEVEDREKVRQIMELNDNIICIAISNIFSTGINISNLHYIIFGNIGKAKVKIIQSIGRGLRLHETKDQLVIYDIADMLTYGERHYHKRLDLYEKEKIEIREFNITES
jgi:superfamily II DNA or RNA helicase